METTAKPPTAPDGYHYTVRPFTLDGRISRRKPLFTAPERADAMAHAIRIQSLYPGRALAVQLEPK